MTAENNTTEFAKSSLRVAFIVVPLTISLLIVISNILVFIRFKRMRNFQACHYFMIGLAVADMMTLIPYSQVTAAIAHGCVVTSKEACCWFGVFTIITIGITMWLHSIMSIKKCLSVCKPLCHRSNTKHKNFQWAVIGIIAVCVLVPTFLCVGMFQLDLLMLKRLPVICASLFWCQRSKGAYILVCAFPGDPDVLAGGYSFLNIVESVFDEESKRQKNCIQSG